MIDVKTTLPKFWWKQKQYFKKKNSLLGVL